MRRLEIPPHVSVDALEQGYRGAHDPVARSQWQIMWLLASGQPTAAVAQSTGYSANWIREVARRYREDGPSGLGDRRHTNPGQAPLLAAAQQDALREALAGPAPDGGVWTGRWVAHWMSQTTHRAVLVVDRAGWHIAGDLRLPDGIDLVFLPAASPELQPAERRWSLVDEPIVNRAFPDLDALETVLVDRCRTLEADSQRLSAHTRFHWWPVEPSPGVA